MGAATVFVVDDEPDVRDALRLLIRSSGHAVQAFASAREFLDQVKLDTPGCLVLDVRMPEMTGLDLQEELGRRGLRIPIVFISGHGDIPMAVRAVQGGAVNFLEKPFSDEALLAAIEQALTRDAEAREHHNELAHVQARLEQLTPRERDVLRFLVEGAVNKVVARELDLSVRTVEIHRARILSKMGVSNASQLVKLVVESGLLSNDTPPQPGA
jgi:two-component system response regulator FixJ